MRQRRLPEKAPSSFDKHNINEDIKVPQVRVIGLDGEQLGVLKTRDAIKLAEDAGVDLVEVATSADPPVCRLLDYGKLKYREQKKAAEARKRSATHVVKEIRMRYNTDSHDLETKVRNARKFLQGGDRVRFQMRFRGREVTYHDLGKQIFQQVLEMLADVAAVEETTPLLGQRMTMTVVPKAAVTPKVAAK